jgi:hypothetical protein
MTAGAAWGCENFITDDFDSLPCPENSKHYKPILPGCAVVKRFPSRAQTDPVGSSFALDLMDSLHNASGPPSWFTQTRTL